jgi:hypothetical protein
METVWANELRGLLPGLRRKFLLGTVAYRDQMKPVFFEQEQDRRLQAAGQRMGFGGQRNMPVEAVVDALARDSMSRTPHFAPVRVDVEVDKLDGA